MCIRDREYTERWIEYVKPLLKETASIYVCCDWNSSPVIGMVLKEHFEIRNRITWQREKGRGARKNWKNGMEDIWFATTSKNYVFNVEDVKLRRRVIAPYRVNGKPKDWEKTSSGNFRNTYPSNFWDDISIPVSYTHLDVYKRQKRWCAVRVKPMSRFISTRLWITRCV